MFQICSFLSCLPLVFGLYVYAIRHLSCFLYESNCNRSFFHCHSTWTLVVNPYQLAGFTTHTEAYHTPLILSISGTLFSVNDFPLDVISIRYRRWHTDPIVKSTLQNISHYLQWIDRLHQWVTRCWVKVLFKLFKSNLDFLLRCQTIYTFGVFICYYFQCLKLHYYYKRRAYFCYKVPNLWKLYNPNFIFL